MPFRPSPRTRRYESALWLSILNTILILLIGAGLFYLTYALGLWR